MSSTAIGKFDHRPYREVEIRMRGIAPGGVYEVPVTLAFPERSKDYSGVALVDVINTVFVIGSFPAPITNVPYPLARIQMGDEYLFGSGHAYLGVEWDKTTVEFRGIGTIGAHADAWTILRDAARLARNPAQVPGAGRPDAARTVIAYGFSQTGALLRGFYHSHQNTVGGLAFDGALYGGAVGFCYEPPLEFTCSGPVSDGGKVIAFSTETDAQLAGFLERGQTSDYRLFELAGVAHIPRPILPFVDTPDQNPILAGPAIRAALPNLIAWTDGAQPPPSTYIELHSEQSVLFGLPFRHAVRDADGNAVGGLRLPHMTASDSRGQVGAPLGTYEGGDLGQTDYLLWLGGKFTPFDATTLATRYPTHQSYVKRVTRAADRLVERRELLKEDAKAYIREARNSTIGR